MIGCCGSRFPTSNTGKPSPINAPPLTTGRSCTDASVSAMTSRCMAVHDRHHVRSCLVHLGVHREFLTVGIVHVPLDDIAGPDHAGRHARRDEITVWIAWTPHAHVAKPVQGRHVLGGQNPVGVDQVLPGAFVRIGGPRRRRWLGGRNLPASVVEHQLFLVFPRPTDVPGTRFRHSSQLRIPRFAHRDHGLLQPRRVAQIIRASPPALRESCLSPPHRAPTAGRPRGHRVLLPLPGRGRDC